MIFYTAYDDRGSVLDVFTRLDMAKEAVRASESRGYVVADDITVSAESIRLILAQQGGYATSTRTAWEPK